MEFLNSDEAPVTNRGVVNTGPQYLSQKSFELKKQYLLVDWIQATVMNPDINIFNLFRDLFGDVPVDVEPEHLFGYDTCYYFKNIKILVAEYRKRENLSDMGYHIYISGSGCRDIEDLCIDYVDLFKKLVSYGAKFTRVDISIDDFTNEYYDLSMIKECIKNGEVVSRFKTSIEFTKKSLLDSSEKGYTVWFGSRASNIQIVFYDKLKERESQHYIVENDIKFWTRLECRFRNEYAQNIISNFVLTTTFNEYFLGVIRNYISFREKSVIDSNKSRWREKDWWSNYLGSIPRIAFQRVNVENSITKSRRWLNDSVSRTNFMVFLSDVSDISSDEITSSFIFEMFKSGSKKITRKDLQYINDYRVKRGLQPFTLDSIRDFIIHIEDFIIDRKNVK